MVPITGEHQVAADTDRLFAALADPATFVQAIDNCDEVVAQDGNQYQLRVKVNMMGIQARQDVQVKILERVPPSRLLYDLGAITPAGEVHATLALDLVATTEGTQVKYAVEGTRSGVLASLGDRLVESSTKRMIADLLKRIDQELTTQA